MVAGSALEDKESVASTIFTASSRGGNYPQSFPELSPAVAHFEDLEHFRPAFNGRKLNFLPFLSFR